MTPAHATSDRLMSILVSNEPGIMTKLTGLLQRRVLTFFRSYRRECAFLCQMPNICVVPFLIRLFHGRREGAIDCSEQEVEAENRQKCERRR